jgi:hypothetical protein
MARNSNLGTMTAMLRKECRYASDSSAGQSKNPALKELLKRTYIMLYDDHDWPHLTSVWEDKAIVAGSRFYDFPANINMENAVKVFHRYQQVWQPVEEGFDTRAYNIVDSDIDERRDPVQAWRVYDGTQFEVWPIPQTNGTLRFVGKKALPVFEADEDVCLLDDHLVVLFAAAEELADKKRGEALKAMAERRLAQVKSQMNKTPSFRPGSDEHAPHRRTGRSVILVR